MPGITTRANVYQTIRVGKEPTPGFGGPTAFRLKNMELVITPEIPVRPVRYPGSKAYTDTQVAKEMASLKFTGVLDFNLLPLMNDTMFGKANPTQLGASAPYGYSRFYNPSPVDPTPHPDTLVIELGSNRGAERMTYAVCSGYAIKWDKDTASFEGTMFGAQGPADRNITITSGTTLVPPSAVHPRNIGVFISDDGTTYKRLNNVISGQLDLNGLWNPNFHVNDDLPSFDGITESMPTFGGQITVDEGSEADIFMSRLRNSQLIYVGLRARGALISAGTGTEDATTAPLFAVYGTGGTLPAANYYFRFAYKTSLGAGRLSPAVMLTTSGSTSSVVINARKLPLNCTGIDVYVSFDGVAYTKGGTSSSERYTVTSPASGNATHDGTNSSGTPNIYKVIRLNMPMLVTKPEPGDKNGVYGNTFTFEIGDDETFGLASLTVINDFATYG